MNFKKSNSLTKMLKVFLSTRLSQRFRPLKPSFFTERKKSTSFRKHSKYVLLVRIERTRQNLNNVRYIRVQETYLRELEVALLSHCVCLSQRPSFSVTIFLSKSRLQSRKISAKLEKSAHCTVSVPTNPLFIEC